SKWRVEERGERMTESENLTAGIEDADAGALAAMVSQASDADLAEGMADPEGRRMVLDQIFARMAEHVEPRQVEGVDAIVHFTITDAPGGGDDVYEVVVKDGTVSVNEEPEAEHPRVTITIGPVNFVRLVTGQQSGPVMFMT